jgi:DNA-binding CsgD family transcriptional regulator
MSPLVDERAVHEYQSNARTAAIDALEKVTARESEVLSLALQGYTSARIAELLRISRRTAETHRANLYKKFGVRSHAELVAFALHSGLISREL